MAEFIRSEYPHCNPVSTIHSSHQDHSDNSLEHGTHAGAGFFQDLALASKARHGFIGTCDRTSSQLVGELIQYERTMDNIRKFGRAPIDELPTCCLPYDETARLQ